jgi:hypothetical protein
MLDLVSGGCPLDNGEDVAEATREDAQHAWTTATQRYRAAYAKLPPGLQLVGLQVWMPVFFVCLFCLCYVNAFHAPAVRDAPVAVVGTADLPALERATGPMFDYHSVGSLAEADSLVRSGSDVAALDLTTPSRPTMVIASAHSYQAANVARQAFAPAFAAAQQQVTVRDLAPLPAHDSFGMTTMYLALAWCIGGYMLALFLGLMGAPLRHRVRVGVILTGGVLLSLLAMVLAGPVLGAVQGHFLPMWGIGFCWMVAIGLATNGLSYFFGRFVAMPAMAIFVFLSIPSSGAAYPTFMLPGFFQFLHPYVVGFGITEMTKHTLYGVGEPYWKGFLLLGCYAAAGLVLMLVGKRWRQRHEVRRILAGRTTMFMDAQAAAREHTIAEREQVLARYCRDGQDAHELAVAAEAHSRANDDALVANSRSLDGVEEIFEDDEQRR